MAKKSSGTFRVGKVQGYLRGSVWYLCYHEHGQRHRPRVGRDKQAAQQLAAQINGQLAAGTPAALSFQPLSVIELRTRWLDHHEHVLRSSVRTIERYRAATSHLAKFLERRPALSTSQFSITMAEEFARHLRTIRVTPNGHPHSSRRPLMDKGVRYILECCRSLFNFAIRRRHLPPYSENPFAVMDIDRIPIEQVRPIELFSSAQERAFLDACDDWQFPLFLTLMLTGLRPGELTHLLLPNDLDLDAGFLRVRNKAEIGWQTKTRNERDVPLLPELIAVLKCHLRERTTGPVFRRRRFKEDDSQVDVSSLTALKREFNRSIEARSEESTSFDRRNRDQIARRLWNDIGTIPEDRVRIEFLRLSRRIGLPECTAPKMLRHLFATTLQTGRVDPLIRNELMGHVAQGERSAGNGLAMTAVYTHSQPATIREQLFAALRETTAVAVARAWLETKSGGFC